MNKRLADVALARAEGGLGEREPGYCQRWARQCVQAVYGDRFNAWFKPTAKETAKAFLQRVPKGARVISTGSVAQSELGDLLFATVGHGGFGHVGIRVAGNRVAENSVIHRGAHGAIGFRPLSEFEFDVIVRLPEPEPEAFTVVAVDDGAVLGRCNSLSDLGRRFPGWKMAPGGDHREDQRKVYVTR